MILRCLAKFKTLPLQLKTFTVCTVVFMALHTVCRAMRYGVSTKASVLRPLFRSVHTGVARTHKCSGALELRVHWPSVSALTLRVFAHSRVRQTALRLMQTTARVRRMFVECWRESCWSNTFTGGSKN